MASTFRRICRALTLVASAAGVVAADEIRLKDGTRQEGDILEHVAGGYRLLPRAGDEALVADADVAKVSWDDWGPEDGESSAFTRYTREGDHPGLQVAVAHYVKAGAPRVDLVGAVHIADATFYRAVQAELDRADTVLYEMVKKKDQDPAAKPTDDEPASDSISKFQARLGHALDLTFQRDGIDYRRRHFVHADMTLEEFLAQGGDAVTKEMDDVLARILPLISIAETLLNPSADASEFRRGVAAKARAFVKGKLAKAMSDLGPNSAGALADLGGDELIIGKRNDVAMKAFDAAKKDVRTIAIFYGAAHMPDLEKRLLARGYVRAGGHWLTAWDVGEKKDDK